MALICNTYIAGSSIATKDFNTFFNEIKDIFIKMGHEYVQDSSDTYKHVFKLNKNKFRYYDYDAILEIKPAVYNSIVGSLPASGTSNDVGRMVLTLSLSNGFIKSTNINFTTNNLYSDLLNSTIARYMTIREWKTDTIYGISFHSGATPVIPYELFDNSSFYSDIMVSEYTDFYSGLENLLHFSGNTYGQNMVPFSIVKPAIFDKASSKILTSPLWLSISNDIRGYIKDMLITSSIEPYSKYTINNIPHVPLDRYQHYLFKE